MVTSQQEPLDYDAEELVKEEVSLVYLAVSEGHVFFYDLMGKWVIPTASTNGETHSQQQRFI